MTTYIQKANFQTYVYLGYVIDPNPPISAPSLNFSQAGNSQYLALYQLGFIL